MPKRFAARPPPAELRWEVWSGIPSEEAGLLGFSRTSRSEQRPEEIRRLPARLRTEMKTPPGLFLRIGTWEKFCGHKSLVGQRASPPTLLLQIESCRDGVFQSKVEAARLPSGTQALCSKRPPGSRRASGERNWRPGLLGSSRTLSRGQPPLPSAA